MPLRAQKNTVLDHRRAGVLLHPTSLPGGIGCGDLGPEARHFIDFLANSGISVWQVLPLGPTHEDRSPYMGLSVLAGNPYLVSLQTLNEWGWLEHSEIDYSHADDPLLVRQQCLTEAWRGFQEKATVDDLKSLKEFTEQHRYWLEDFALFQAIRKHQQGRSWVDWPAKLRDRDPAAIEDITQELHKELDQTRFEQFVFYRQWHELRHYAHERGVKIFGDMPIFVAHDSAEVWANRDNFDIDSEGHSRTIAGVPPDYFSETGQRWGNPHYNWKAMKADGFSWWIKRIRGTLELFDLVRVDHFRGFESYWEIMADEETAINGRWVKTPGRQLFNTLLETFSELPFIAEDLGTITPAVDALREKYGWPGMKILQFAFDGHHNNPYLPHNHTENSVAYTGTHDNDTTLGWYQSLDANSKNNVQQYLATNEEMPWAMIRCALASVSKLAMLPMQDLLALDAEHRMNIPGTSNKNWQWRFEWSQVSEEMPARLKHLVKLYGRHG